MNIITDDEAADKGYKYAKGKVGFMVIQVAMLQGKELPRNRAYLDNCFTVTSFKTAKCIRSIKAQKKGMQVNCNAGSVNTNRKGEYGRTNIDVGKALFFLLELHRTLIRVNHVVSTNAIIGDMMQILYLIHG